MTVITHALLKQALPNLRDNAMPYTNMLEEICMAWKVDTDLRKCHYLANITHECADFSAMRENLNYSVKGLKDTFPKYFTKTGSPPTFDEQKLAAYARNPEKIANYVYANRMGNGSEASGDGWRYRGGGPIGLTGRDNYTRCGAWMGVDLAAAPDKISDPKTGLISSVWFWTVNKVYLNADKDDAIAVCKGINGGTIGMPDRLDRLARLKRVFGIDGLGMGTKGV